MKRMLVVWAVALLMVLPSLRVAAAGETFEVTIPPGTNFDKADFRLWLPAETASVRAIVVLTTGSNGDGRPMADDVAWQAFATRNKTALVGVRLTDKTHDQSFIEEYANVSQGSGQALLDALSVLAERAKHPELATAPLLLWGMSAGGEFNYEFTAWKPARVAAFVANKGGIYYTALTSRASRNVPGMLFTGGKDLQSRISTITGLFEVNRRAGALWALAEEPGVAHVVGRSIDVTRIFFEDVLALRLQGTTMKTLNERDGFLGDIQAKTFRPMGSAAAPATATAWLPSERVARVWQAMMTEKPLE